MTNQIMISLDEYERFKKREDESRRKFNERIGEEVTQLTLEKRVKCSLYGFFIGLAAGSITMGIMLT